MNSSPIFFPGMIIVIFFLILIDHTTRKFNRFAVWLVLAALLITSNFVFYYVLR